MSKLSLEELLHCTGVSCRRVVSNDAFSFILVLVGIASEVIKEVSYEVTPPLFTDMIFFFEGLDIIQSIVGNLLCLRDRVESNAIVVALGIAVTLEQVIEVFDGCRKLLLSQLSSLMSM